MTGTTPLHPIFEPFERFRGIFGVALNYFPIYEPVFDDQIFRS